MKFTIGLMRKKENLSSSPFIVLIINIFIILEHHPLFDFHSIFIFKTIFTILHERHFWQKNFAAAVLQFFCCYFCYMNGNCYSRNKNSRSLLKYHRLPLDDLYFCLCSSYIFDDSLAAWYNSSFIAKSISWTPITITN